MDSAGLQIAATTHSESAPAFAPNGPEPLRAVTLPGYGLSATSRAAKRALDLTVALVALVLLAPLLAAIALAIKLDSPGPVFYRQRRVGLGRRTFSMWKFRTMTDGAHDLRAGLVHLSEAEGLFKLSADPRTTYVGRMLRRTSLDELPQLLNVLRGQMSIVGPRPLIEDEDARVGSWGRRRLELRPGITGAWQLLGPTRASLHQMARMDYVYGAGWSPWLDLKIMLRTVAHMAARRGV